MLGGRRRPAGMTRPAGGAARVSVGPGVRRDGRRARPRYDAAFPDRRRAGQAGARRSRATPASAALFGRLAGLDTVAGYTA